MCVCVCVCVSVCVYNHTHKHTYHLKWNGQRRLEERMYVYVYSMYAYVPMAVGERILLQRL